VDQDRPHRSLVDQLDDLLDGNPKLRCRDEIRHEAERLATGRLNVVVVGHFKRGKSSLLNAIIGRPVLPVGVTPVTALVTLIRRGPAESAHVHFLDGRKESISLDSLADFISEKANPKNLLAAEKVDIELPDLDIPPNVVLADTPGTGSVFRHNTEALQRWLGHIDAAVFVISADPPVGEAELELLREVRSRAGETRIVLNKIDRLQGDELEEAVDYARKAVENPDGAGSEMLPCSARMALEGRDPGSGVLRLREWIGSLAFREGDAVLQRAAARRLTRILSHEHALVEMEMAAATRNSTDLGEAFRLLGEIRLEMSHHLDDALAVHRAGRRALLENYDRAAFRETPALKEALEAALRSFAREAGERRLGGPRFLKDLEETRDRKAQEILEPFQNLTEKGFIDGFNRLSRRALRHINRLVDDAYARAGQAFDLQLKPVDIAEGFRMDSRLSYQVGLPKVKLDFLSDWTLMLLPSPLSRRAMLRRQLKMLDETLDRQLGLIRADLAERLNESAISFEAELQRRVDAAGLQLLDALEGGRALLRADRESARVRLQELERLGARLLDLLESCRHLSPGSDPHAPPFAEDFL